MKELKLQYSASCITCEQYIFQTNRRRKSSDGFEPLDKIRDLVEKNELQPVLDKSFPFKQAETAVQHVLDRGEALVGKIAVTLAEQWHKRLIMNRQ